MTKREDDIDTEQWEGIMIEYTEQDFPGSQPYKREVPGWLCKRCGFKVGALGPPPSNHRCTEATP